MASIKSEFPYILFHSDSSGKMPLQKKKTAHKKQVSAPAFQPQSVKIQSFTHASKLYAISYKVKSKPQIAKILDLKLVFYDQIYSSLPFAASISSPKTAVVSSALSTLLTSRSFI